MSLPLWTLEEFVAAVSGAVVGTPAEAITGVSIDSRTLEPGEAFIAIAGDRFDGHDFVEAALKAGASLALVARDRLASLPADGRYVVVDDVLEGLRCLGRAARARVSARIVAVTGSVGKTGTKEALRLALSRCGKTHASVASFNNHWGVPLTLARMPRDVDFGVFEIGMNHAGEITPLVQMVRPHVAIITTVQPVHLEFFDSVESIAKAKAEIFSGLEPGGVAILNRDNDQFDLLTFLAKTGGVTTIRTFGEGAGSDGKLLKHLSQGGTSVVQARILGEEITYKIGAPGMHVVKNSLAVLATAARGGADLARAGLALAGMAPPKGRGERHALHLGHGVALLIDESYNANPASMRAAIDLLGHTTCGLEGRRIAVLGDMLELGTRAETLHAGLAEALIAARIDRVFLAGPLMHALWRVLPTDLQGAWAPNSKELEPKVLAAVRAGDALMVKGSNGSRMAPIVEALKSRFSSTRALAEDV